MDDLDIIRMDGKVLAVLGRNIPWARLLEKTERERYRALLLEADSERNGVNRILETWMSGVELPKTNYVKPAYCYPDAVPDGFR